MPITYQLRHEERLVVLVHAGVVTNGEFMSFYKTLYEDTQFEMSFNMLVDLRQAESSARSAATLYEFADFIRRQYVSTNATPKVAVVAPEDISFGLARMYEALSEEVPWEFEVFRAIDAALAWLGLPDSLMNDLDQDIQP